MNQYPHRSADLRPAAMALIALLTLATVAASQPLAIPETAPDGEPTDWCGTGRLNPSEYQSHWTEWRGRALAARTAGDRLCAGLALSELGILTDRQDLGYLGKDYWQAAFAILEPAAGKGDPRLVQSLLRLGGHRRNPEQGNREAEALVRRAVEILETLLAHPEDQPPPLSCHPRSAGETATGEMPDAADYFRPEVLSRSRLEYRRDNLDLTLVEAFQQLARLRSEAGRHRGAVTALDRGLTVLEDRESRAGSSDRWDLTWRAQSIVRQLADVAEQDPATTIEPSIVERGVALVRRNAGSAHELAQSLGELATFHAARGDLAVAEDILRAGLAAIDGREDPSGRGDLWRSSLIRQLRKIYQRQRRWDDLEALLLADLAAVEAGGPDRSSPFLSKPAVTGPLQQLAYFYHQRDRPADQQIVLRRLVDLDPDGFYVHLQLGRVRQALGQLPAAEASFLRTLELLRAEVKPSNTNLVSPLLGLAEIYRQQGREAHELDVLRQAEEVYDHLFAEKNGDVAPVTQWGKARVLLAGRRLAEAEALYQRAEAGILADPDAHRANLATPRQDLARIATARGDRPAALAFLRSAAGAFEEAYGDDPERLARGLRDVAGTSRELGFESEAKDLEARAVAVGEGAGS